MVAIDEQTERTGERQPSALGALAVMPLYRVQALTAACTTRSYGARTEDARDLGRGSSEEPSFEFRRLLPSARSGGYPSFPPHRFADGPRPECATFPVASEGRRKRPGPGD